MSAMPPTAAPTPEAIAAAFNGLSSAEMPRAQVLLKCQMQSMICLEWSYQKAAVEDNG